MKKQHDKFIQGCVANGMVKAKAEKLWILFEPFAGYGFGKAHEKLFKLEQQKQDRLAKIIKEAENPVKLRHREVLSEAFESGINLISSKLKRRKKAKSVIV